MGIDLNTVELDEPAGGAVCAELWHACAGAGVALPRRGSAVVYLPQAHLAAGGDGGELPALAAAAPRVPPHVVCRVVDVELGVSLCPTLCRAARLVIWFCFVSLHTPVRDCVLRAGGCGDGRGVRAACAGGGG